MFIPCTPSLGCDLETAALRQSLLSQEAVNRDRLFQPTGQPSFEQWQIEDVNKAISRMVELSKQQAPGGGGASNETALVVANAGTANANSVVLRVGWKDYYQVLTETEQNRWQRVRHEERTRWHPATKGYTMNRDPDSQALLEEYQRGKRVRPGLRNHEIDGHTDDSASDTETASEFASTADEESGNEDGDGEKKDGDEDGSDEDGSYDEEDGSGEDGSDEDGSDDDDDDDDSGEDGSGEDDSDEDDSEEDGDDDEDSEEGSGDEVENALRRARFVDRLIPESFDPALRSPAFFGYTYETVEEEALEEQLVKQQEADDEESMAQKQKQQQRDALKKSAQDDEDRRHAHKSKRERILQNRDKRMRKREQEWNHSKKMLAPDDPFFVNWKETEAETKLQEEEDDVEWEARSAAQEALLEERHKRRVQAAAAVETSESLDRPRGPKLMAVAQEELIRCVDQLDSSRTELEDAERLLHMTVEGAAESEGQSRSLILSAKDDAKRKERSVEANLTNLAEAEHLLDRALVIQEAEARFLPLFEVLVSEISYTVDLGELLVALAMGCKLSKLSQKLRSLFNFFDHDRKSLHSPRKMLAFVTATTEMLWKLGDIRRRYRVSNDEKQSIVDLAFKLTGLTAGKAMPFFQFEQWLLHVIKKSRTLAELFNVPWEFEQLSEFQRQQMDCVHQYEIGMIHMIDLKYRLSRELVRYRPQLSPDRKEEVHELALGMGRDDPLKPDYSKFLKKKRRRGYSNVIPLEHGHLGNLTVWRRQTAYEAAMRIQSVWRAKLGRERANQVARKNAFYHAKLMVLLETREKIERDWLRREAQKGVAKMKWDAKVRMKQVQLRSRGFNLDRDGAFRFMMEEAVQEVQEADVEKKFAEMEIERGYAGSDTPAGMDGVSGKLIGQIAKAKGKQWPPPLETEEEEKMALEAAKEASLIAEEIPTEPMSAADQQKKVELVEHESNKLREEKTKETEVDSSALLVKQEIEKEPPLGHTPSLGRHRMEKMVFGEFPPELYITGETEQEARLREELAHPMPSYRAMYSRLQRLSDVMSDLKTEELLLELPSKRLICKYVQQFPAREDLIENLFEHFRIVRDTEIVADALRNFAQSDFEHGYLNKSAFNLREKQDVQILELARTQHADAVEVSEAIALQKARAAALRMADQSEEEMAIELGQKEQDERKRRSKQVDDAKKAVLKASNALEKYERTLQECQRRQTKRDAPVILEPTHYINWAHRYVAAAELPEDDDEMIMNKATELKNVAGDFLGCARQGATQIVNEFFLPIREKTIKPVSSSDTDLRQGQRMKFVYMNIYFKVAIDDHGICNGCDEHSSKFAGNEIRSSRAYIKCKIAGLNIPLQTVVDYYGFRVFCCAMCPLKKTLFNKQGEIKKVTEDRVYGTEDRGKKIKSTNKLLETKLMQAARKLNLARHGVKGEDDLTVKFVPAAGDMKGYKGEDGRLYVINFRRGFPMEDPEATHHLPQSERGQSIFWRMLRPEFVRDYPVALSPDANVVICKDAPDWEKHTVQAKEAAQYLVKELVPAFAEELAQRPITTEGKLPSIENLDITQEMHRRGINMRHIGLLRTKFWFQLEGTAELQFNKPLLRSAKDFRREVGKGYQVRVSGVLNRVSFDGTHGPHQIALQDPHRGNSCKGIPVFAGEVSNETNSGAVRSRLLAEMIARATKQLIRYYLRELLSEVKAPLDGLLNFVIVEFLNMLSGAHPNSENFWSNQLFLAIQQRYGPCAVSVVERPNMRRYQEPEMAYVMVRLQSMLGFRLSQDCMERFSRKSQYWEENRLFRFETTDFEDNSSFITAKHNLCHLEYYKGVLSMTHARQRQDTTYSASVLADDAIAYWRLTERIGSKIAKNLGTGGVSMCAYFAKSVIYEAPGPVRNDDLNRSTRFGRDARHPAVDIKYQYALAPQAPQQHFTVEGWARSTGGEGTLRVVVNSGRYMLAALKSDCWGFVVFGMGTEVTVHGPKVVDSKWTHLFGTYDGTVMRFYVDSVLVDFFEVGPAFTEKLEENRLSSIARWKAIDDAEEDGRINGRKRMVQEADKYFRTKNGNKDMKDTARKLQQQADFRLKMNARAREEGAKRLGKKEALEQAKSDYTDKIWSVAMKTMAEDFQQKREALRDAERKEKEEMEMLATRDMKIGGACATKRAKLGKHHFIGDIAHIAMYSVCLSHDKANARYVAGSQERALESDRLYELAHVHFTRAMLCAADDPDVLHNYASSICSALRYDNAHLVNSSAYKQKVMEGIAIFKALGNPKGLCEVIRCMPGEECYGDLCCLAFETIQEISPGFFTSRSYMNLEELGRLHSKFSIFGPAAEPEKVKVGTDMVKLVLHEYPSFYGDGATNLGWLCKLKTPPLIAYFVVAVESDGDLRHLDLWQCTEMSDEELQIVADNRRDLITILVPKCTKISNVAVIGGRALAHRCQFLEKINFDSCDLLTDKAVLEFARETTEIRSMNFARCGKVSDEGVIAMTESCKYLREITLNNCEFVTDESIMSIAQHSLYLELLHVGFCLQVSNLGLIGLSRALCCSTLTSLDFSACRRISDHGITHLMAKTTRLTSLNLYFCNKITDRGIKAVTHNCWDLEYLNLQDLYQVTDLPFFYDHEGDGRPAVDKYMLHKLKTLNLADCKELSDHGISEVSRRCTLLEHLTLAGCTKLTDHGVTYLTVDASSGATRGQWLKYLDVTFCIKLTDASVDVLVKRCKRQLQSVYLSGCVEVSDEAIQLLARECNGLQCVGLAHCRLVSDRALESLADNLWIEELDLSHCQQITDAGIEAVARESPGLRSLNVSWCRKITNRSLDCLMENCKLLRTVDIANCDVLAEETVSRLRLLNQRIEVIVAKKKVKPSTASKELVPRK
jgi:hypothetical protein